MTHLVRRNIMFAYVWRENDCIFELTPGVRGVYITSYIRLITRIIRVSTPQDTSLYCRWKIAWNIVASPSLRNSNSNYYCGHTEECSELWYFNTFNDKKKKSKFVTLHRNIIHTQSSAIDTYRPPTKKEIYHICIYILYLFNNKILRRYVHQQSVLLRFILFFSFFSKTFDRVVVYIIMCMRVHEECD